MNDLKPKMKIPPRQAMILCEVRGCELWPLSRVDVRDDGHCEFVSGAANAPLMVTSLEKVHALAVKHAAAVAAGEQIRQLREGARDA